MPTRNEIYTTMTEDDIIASYEQEFTRSTAERDEEIARVALEKVLYAEYGEIRDGAEVIPGDQ